MDHNDASGGRISYFLYVLRMMMIKKNRFAIYVELMQSGLSTSVDNSGGSKLGNRLRLVQCLSVDILSRKPSSLRIIIVFGLTRIFANSALSNAYLWETFE